MKTEFTDSDLKNILQALQDQFSNEDDLSMYRDIHEHFSGASQFMGDDHVFSIFDRKKMNFISLSAPMMMYLKKLLNMPSCLEVVN